MVLGEPQGEKVSASSLHSKLEPASEEENVKVGVGSLVVAAGPESIVVCGGIASAETSFVVPAERS